MLSGGLVSQTPLLLGFRQIPAYKSIVPLQGFEPRFAYARLTKSTHLIPSDVRHQRQMEIFAALKYPRKTWLRIS